MPKTLLERFTSICLRMEEEAGRETLTEEEEEEAMLILWYDIYGDNNEPTPDELMHLWEELANEFAQIIERDEQDKKHAAAVMQHHKRLIH